MNTKLDTIANNSFTDLKVELGLAKKIGKRCQKYMNIMERGMITKSETVVLKSILSNHALRYNLTDDEVSVLMNSFEIVDKGKVRITPEHTTQGLNFFKSLIYTPTGKIRRKALEYLDSIDSDVNAKSMKVIIDNFSHFELAGFEGNSYSHYKTSYTYSPMWRVVAKDGTDFTYTQVCVGEATGTGRWR